LHWHNAYEKVRAPSCGPGGKVFQDHFHKAETVPQKELFDLTGRVVILTGGTGQLGRAFTRSLVDAGVRLAVIDRAEIDAPKDGMSIVCDVTDKAGLEDALVRIEKALGEPVGLINAAALDSPPGAPIEENGPFETYPEASWDKVMSVNAKGVFLCCQVFGGAMAQRGKGSIINIASIYGQVSPDQGLYQYRRDRGETFYKPVAYSASKSALYNFSRYLATYWGPKNVRVNTLTLAGVFNNQDPEFLEKYCAKVPLGRMADEDEYNGAIQFLLSDASRYLTGSNIVVDGGFTAW